MGRIEYIALRIAKAFVLILLIAVLNFLIVRLAPGDPASVMAGESGAADPIYMEQLREQFRLNDPLLVQLWTYMSGIVQFDLGFSYRNQETVARLVFDRLPATLILTGAGFVLALIIGMILGAVAATYRGRWPDTIIGGACVFLYATPIFWVGLMAVLLFAATWNLLPAFGSESIVPLDGWAWFWDRIKHLILPALTLASHYVPIYARLTRAAMIEVQSQEFVRLARAKGLPPFRVATAHVLRNSLLPVVTFAGVHAGNLIGGSILVETIFAWPGIGRLALDSLLVRDYNTLLGVFFICSVLTILFNLITDIIYTAVDPRIEIEK